MRGSGEFFAATFDDISGSLTDLYPGVDYRVMDSLSIGAGVNAVILDVESTKNRFRGQMDWQCVGGFLFLKVNF